MEMTITALANWMVGIVYLFSLWFIVARRVWSCLWFEKASAHLEAWYFVIMAWDSYYAVGHSLLYIVHVHSSSAGQRPPVCASQLDFDVVTPSALGMEILSLGRSPSRPMR